MLIIIIILIIVIIIIQSNKTKCPKCGSTDIADIDSGYGSAGETGLWAILASLINPASAQSYARRTANTKHHRCRKCGHKF